MDDGPAAWRTETPVHRGQPADTAWTVVMVDGKKKWLECYKIIGEYIYTHGSMISKDGTRSYKQYSPVDEKSMRPVEGIDRYHPLYSFMTAERF